MMTLRGIDVQSTAVIGFIGYMLDEEPCVSMWRGLGVIGGPGERNGLQIYFQTTRPSQIIRAVRLGPLTSSGSLIVDMQLGRVT